MNNSPQLFEWKGYVLCVFFLLFSTAFFSYYAGEFYYSSIAGFFSAALAWSSYLVIRMIILAGGK